ncbi:MAG TPA: LamG domain-containing protein [Lentimicrobium sp.]|nr:LamG domain-containing protein [Lentimicrobium sp.]
MKILKTIFMCSLFAMFTVGCEQELDEITPVKPGADTEDPTLVINFPIAGKVVRVMPDNPAVNLTVTVTDDIELKSVTFDVDGQEVGKTESFKDYRRAVLVQPVNDLPDGPHVMSVTVEDLTGKVVTVTRNFDKVTATPYTPLDGEVIYFPFEGNYKDDISDESATKVGTPTFATGKIGDAYKGATDSYITFPADVLTGSSEFSVAFWYKINATPVRGGLISLSKPEVASQDNRNTGFRMGRENNASNDQNIFANLGINPDLPGGEVWLNPFYVASPNADWLHIAVSISTDTAVVYINGAQVMEAALATPINWAGVTTLTIGSGETNWTYWDHFSDLSLFDEMHFFTRAITPEEVTLLYSLTK